jgi:hypothetical protein
VYVPTDLHGHTLFSDGRATPEEYVELRRTHGFALTAISDHDVLAAVPRGAAAAARAGLAFLPAVEVTAFFHFGTDRAEQVHVLAYYPPHVAAPPLLRRTALWQRGLRVQARWREFVLAWVADRPADERAALGEADLVAMDAADFPALQATIDRVTRRRPELFDAFRRHHVRFGEDDRDLFGWEPEAVIDAIRADGATDVVAHPGRYRDRERTRALALRATGVEAYTSRHRGDVAKEWRELAEANGKLWTASTDDHQNAPYVRPPCGTPVATVERLLGHALPIEQILAGK